MPSVRMMRRIRLSPSAISEVERYRPAGNAVEGERREESESYTSRVVRSGIVCGVGGSVERLEDRRGGEGKGGGPCWWIGRC
jgi:hypothetical protein